MRDTTTRVSERTRPSLGPSLREVNWVWFAERSGGAACELGGKGVPGDPRLDRLFSDVHRVESPTRIAERFGSEAVDAVVVHKLPGGTSDPSRVLFFRECHRILRPGGYVVFCVDYSWWYRRLFCQFRQAGGRGSWAGEGFRTSDIRTAKRWLTEAGFGQVRCYLGDGNATRLRVIVPVSRTSLIGIERINGRSPPRKALRRILTSIGLGPVFYRTLLVFGYR